MQQVGLLSMLCRRVSQALQQPGKACSPPPPDRAPSQSTLQPPLEGRACLRAPRPSGACEQELSEEPLLQLASVDLLALDAPTPHIARFLPWVKDSAAPFTFLVQIMVPGSTPIALCIAWAAQAPPDSPDSHQSMPQAPIDLSLARWAPKTLWGLAAACSPRQ